MQAVSKLDHYSKSLCSAVDTTLAANLPSFPPREFSSLLWVFVNFRHAPSSTFWHSLATLLVATRGLGVPDAAPLGSCGSENGAPEPPQHSPRQLEVWHAPHWATLIWAAGKMAWKPPSDLWVVLEEAVERHMADFKPQELCNMLWYVAIHQFFE